MTDTEQELRTRNESVFFLRKKTARSDAAGRIDHPHDADADRASQSRVGGRFATTQMAGSSISPNASFAQQLGPRGIRVNAVAQLGLVWAPRIVATLPAEAQDMSKSGRDTLRGRPAQPAEHAGVYVFLASDDSRAWHSGAVVPVGLTTLRAVAPRQVC